MYLHKLSDHFNRHSGITTKINIKNCSMIVVRILDYLKIEFKIRFLKNVLVYLPGFYTI